MTPENAVHYRRNQRTWISVIGIVGILIAIILAGAFVTKHLYDQAMGVRADLVSAVAEVKEVQRAVLAADLEAASAASLRLSIRTETAVKRSSGRLWSAASALPFIGDDLVAVRQVAVTANKLAHDVVAPASAVSLDAFQPVEGRISLDAVAELSVLVDQVDEGINDALVSLGEISRGGLLEQVLAGVEQLDAALAEVQPTTGAMRSALSVLPDALGQQGPRDYLLMFQGISEARSLGGNAAIFIVLRAEAGSISIIDEIASQDFHNAPPKSVVDLNPQAEQIYGDKIGRYTADFTMVPDFPDAVRILSAWWQREDFTPYDAVMSFDPVALSYLLAATGPVQLPTGELLTADNAASLLLNEVYFDYSDPLEQNRFFAGAAGAVFDAVTSGRFKPIALVDAVTRSVEEARLLFWSEDPREMDLIAGSRMSGVLPADNGESTVLGAYVNDNTTSKKSYYLDMSILLCREGTSASSSVTLKSSVTEDQAAKFPYYITGGFFEAGDISTYLVLYGPVGATLSTVTFDGAPAQVLSSGEHLGRPAVKLEVFTRPQAEHTVVATFTGLSENAGPLEAWHTPMVREVPVAVSEGCK